MDKETPQHYTTQGLELMTHPAVSDAYALFWREVSRMAVRVRQRRAARQEAASDTMQTDADETRQAAA